jgi:tmRNA-binding protein
MAKSPKKNPASSTDRVIENRKARFDYHILEELECGIILKGGEVKSVRAGAVSLAEGWVKAISHPPALLLYAINIAEYGPSGPITGGVGASQHKPTRPRALARSSNSPGKPRKKASRSSRSRCTSRTASRKS